jgi:branched-chain amino acid transport system substrate-binding protein
VKEALERVKMLPAAAGAPGTRISFGKWTRRAWMGAGYLVARRLDPDGDQRLVPVRLGLPGHGTVPSPAPPPSPPAPSMKENTLHG